jgi:hypothetical protein
VFRDGLARYIVSAVERDNGLRGFRNVNSGIDGEYPERQNHTHRGAGSVIPATMRLSRKTPPLSVSVAQLSEIVQLIMVAQKPSLICSNTPHFAHFCAINAPCILRQVSLRSAIKSRIFPSRLKIVLRQPARRTWQCWWRQLLLGSGGDYTGGFRHDCQSFSGDRKLGIDNDFMEFQWSSL